MDGRQLFSASRLNTTDRILVTTDKSNSSHMAKNNLRYACFCFKFYRNIKIFI